MSNELKVIEKIELVPFFTESDGVDEVLAKIAEEARAHVPDVTTAKGRAAIKANVTLVTKSKTYLESRGKELAAEYKEIPKRIDATRRKTKTFLEGLQAEVRQKLTEWEAEEQRKKDDEEARIAAEKLAAQIESDHEIAILLNEKYDRELAEAEAEKERQRIAHEAEIAQKAKERALEEFRQRQIAEENARIAAEQEKARQAAEAERLRIEDQARKDAEHKAAIERAEAEKAEAERKAAQAIEDERRRVALEAEQKRLEDEKRERNKKHIGEVRKAAKEALIAEGLSEDQAKKIVLAINAGKIPHIKINY